jgi:hypothetical protein
MHPEDFMRLTGATYNELAEICDRAYPTVARWFCRGKSRLKPSPQDLRILELEYRLRTVERG